MKKLDNRPFHPLFLPKEGDADFAPPSDFDSVSIFITRFSANGPEEAPRDYLLSEIPNRQTLFEMFGGGRYELEARTNLGQFYARRGLSLAGPSKPLVAPPPKDETQPSPGAPNDLGAIAGMMGGQGGGAVAALASGNPMALLMMVLLQQGERAEARAERQAMQSIETLKVMATMFGGNRSGTDPAIASVFASMTDLVKSQHQAASAPQQLAPQQTIDQEIERATKIVKLVRSMDPKAKEESLGEFIKELMPHVQPFLPLIFGGGANGALPVGTEMAGAEGMGEAVGAAVG